MTAGAAADHGNQMGLQSRHPLALALSMVG
jgi:hypothetical protein